MCTRKQHLIRKSKKRGYTWSIVLHTVFGAEADSLVREVETVRADSGSRGVND